jgi:hypothetical protein
MEVLRDVDEKEACFGPFNTRQVHGLRQHTVGLEIILDAPDCTPK